MKTHIATPEEIQSTHKFHVVDAADVPLGRLASHVAALLTGKNKPIYTPFLDTGDHVIVINAEKVALSGRKWENKEMIHHTRYPGGLKRKVYRRAVIECPEKLVHKAIWGMVPKTRLGRKMIKKLRVYKGPEHPHQSCKPVPYETLKKED